MNEKLEIQLADIIRNIALTKDNDELAKLAGDLSYVLREFVVDIVDEERECSPSEYMPMP